MNWLSLSVMLTLLPLYRQFPGWVLPACLAISVPGIAGYRQRWLLTVCAVASAFGVFLQYGTLFSREAGMALLALLLCLKLAETKGSRDAFLVVMLCYFLLMTWFFDSQAIPAAAGMLFMLVILTADLVRINAGAGVWASLRLSFRLLVQAAPMAAVFFLLFPRIPGPIWALPQAQGRASSGLSDTLSPGSIGNLVLSDEVAFRVEFGSKMPQRSRLYWRGPVMWDYDGKTWTAGGPRPSRMHLHVLGGLVSYDVTLEPDGRRWLFALDMPYSHPLDSTIMQDGQIVAAAPVKERKRYEMTSSLEYEAGLDESAGDLAEATRIPDGGNPRSRSLAASWKGEPAGEVARHAIAFFRSHGFVYTLSPPLLGSDQVDDFLFGTRSGFCEHYASSFAFLMRAAGIPARIVTGYQGGEINPIGNYLTVRQSDAHAWVEIWEKGRGWLRIDPTAIVAPTRIESGISAALPVGEGIPLMMRQDAAWLRSLRFGWDAAANAWNQWVVGFGEEKQKQLFGNFGIAGVKDIAATFAVVVSVLLIAMTGFLLLRSGKKRPDRVLESYLRFCRKMKRHGVGRMESEGPLDYAKRIAILKPEAASRAKAVIRLYVLLRYGERTTAADLSEFERLVKSF